MSQQPDGPALLQHFALSAGTPVHHMTYSTSGGGDGGHHEVRAIGHDGKEVGSLVWNGRHEYFDGSDTSTMDLQPGEISSVVVHGDHERKGIGRAMMEHARARATIDGSAPPEHSMLLTPEGEGFANSVPGGHLPLSQHDVSKHSLLQHFGGVGDNYSLDGLKLHYEKQPTLGGEKHVIHARLPDRGAPVGILSWVGKDGSRQYKPGEITWVQVGRGYDGKGVARKMLEHAQQLHDSGHVDTLPMHSDDLTRDGRGFVKSVSDGSDVYHEHDWDQHEVAYEDAAKARPRLRKKDFQPVSVLQHFAEAKSIEVAGLCLKAKDSGRILLIQRSNEDESDPARGTWEFPGGHIDEGEDPLAAARREFSEETGLKIPGDAEVTANWVSPNGIYQGFVLTIPTEDDIDLNPDHEDRHVRNPDDPKGDDIEVVAWWDIADLPDMPALRREVKHTPWKTIKQAILTTTSAPHPITQQDWFHAGHADERSLSSDKRKDEWLHVGTQEAALARVAPDQWAQDPSEPKSGRPYDYGWKTQHKRLKRVQVVPGATVCPTIHTDDQGCKDCEVGNHYPDSHPSNDDFDEQYHCGGQFDVHRYTNNAEDKGSMSLIVRPSKVRVVEDMGRHPAWSQSPESKSAARKPVRRDPLTGIELCNKKVDGFPCKHMLGHAQACDVDWNAAYPDEPETKKESSAGPITVFHGTDSAGANELVRNGNRAGLWVSKDKGEAASYAGWDYMKGRGGSVVVEGRVDPMHWTPTHSEDLVDAGAVRTAGAFRPVRLHHADGSVTDLPTVKTSSKGPCPACSGSGEQGTGHECYKCDGSGALSAYDDSIDNAHPENGLLVGRDDAKGIEPVTAGANGDLPEGMHLEYHERKMYDDPNDTVHFIHAVHPEHGRIGELAWSGHDRNHPGEIENAWVHREHRRKGIGRAMLEHGRMLAATTLKGKAPAPFHSDFLTEDGQQYADATPDGDLSPYETQREDFVKTTHVLDTWEPTDRLFAPTNGSLDPRLFDGDKIRPEVRDYVMGRLAAWWDGRYSDWRTWSKVYLAGSSISEWWADNAMVRSSALDHDAIQSTAGANGDLPEGMTFEHRHRDGLHTIDAHTPERRNVGSIEWYDEGPGYGAIGGVDVMEPYQRRGIASELLKRAREHTPGLHHSEDLTPAGAEWARRTGAHTVDPRYRLNDDLDTLIGVEYKGLVAANPQFAGMSPKMVSAHLNAELREHCNIEGVCFDVPEHAVPEWEWAGDPVDGKVKVGPWGATWYVNPNSYDIRAIKPYAAYNLTDDEWAVRPVSEPTGHKFSPTEWYYFEGVAQQVKGALALPEPARSNRAKRIWEHIHSSRSGAFGPHGQGVFDYRNVVEKFLTQHPDHLWDRLVEARFGPQSSNTFSPDGIATHGSKDASGVPDLRAGQGARGVRREGDGVRAEARAVDLDQSKQGGEESLWQQLVDARFPNQKASSQEREVTYHLTDNPHFALNPDHQPEDNALSIRPREHKGLYTAERPSDWTGTQGYVRPYVAEIHSPKGVATDERWGGEKFIPAEHFDKVKVHRVIPLDAHEREAFGEHGRIETHHGSEFDSGKPIERDGWDQPPRHHFGEGYHYDGPDVRDMTPEQHTQHYNRWKGYMTGDRGFGHNEFDDAKQTLAAPKDEDFDEEGMFIKRDQHGQKIAGANGDLPEGIRFEHSQDEHDHHITARVPGAGVSGYWPKDAVGRLSWTKHDLDPDTSPIHEISRPLDAGTVTSVDVHPGYQRRGIASAMWEQAKAHTDRLGAPGPYHSELQTDEGKEWAAKTATADWEKAYQERGYNHHGWHDWQQGGCLEYAHALIKEKPSLRFGVMGNTYEDDDGDKYDTASHFFAHDDTHAYDSAGKHSLPYHGIDPETKYHADWSRTDEDPDEHDFPDEETIERARKHVREHGILEGKYQSKIASKVDPTTLHPNMNHYRDSGMGGVGEDYWPSDIHPSHIFASDGVLSEGKEDPPSSSPRLARLRIREGRNV